MALPAPASYDEKLKEYDSVPLFMQSLPGPGEIVDDTAINALQSLAYEGPPDEVARNFKDQGNEYFRDKRYREALGFYTQGVDAKPEDKSILEALLCNRAACNLELQNYGFVLRDCSEAIRLNSRCSKAYYRSVLALLALDRYEDALDAIQRGLDFDGNNTGLLALRERADKAKAVREEKEQKRLESIRKEKAEKERMRDALKERHLLDLPRLSGSPDTTHVPHFDENDEPPTLVLPAIFLYPQYAQSDIVPTLREDTMIGDQLSGMFPPGAEAPSWDSKSEYILGKLVVYAITHAQRLLKVGAKMTLCDLFKAVGAKEGKDDSLELRDGYLSLVVLPKGEVEQGWVNDFKKSRAK